MKSKDPKHCHQMNQRQLLFRSIILIYNPGSENRPKSILIFEVLKSNQLKTKLHDNYLLVWYGGHLVLVSLSLDNLACPCKDDGFLDDDDNDLMMHWYVTYVTLVKCQCDMSFISDPQRHNDANDSMSLLTSLMSYTSTLLKSWKIILLTIIQN